MPDRPWTCQKCGKLLAMVNEQAIAVRVSKGRGERLIYESRLPARVTCSCATRNEMPASREGQGSSVVR